MRFLLACVVLISFFSGCNSDKNEPAPAGTLQLSRASVGTQEINFNSTTANNNMPLDKPIVVDFSAPLEITSVSPAASIKKDGSPIPVTISFLNEDKTFSILPSEPLKANTTYTLVVSDAIKGKNKETFSGITVEFKTVVATLSVISLKMGGVDVTALVPAQNISRTTSIELVFSSPLLTSTVTPSNIKILGKNPGTLAFALSEQNKKLTITTSNVLDHLSRYSLTISNSLQGTDDEIFNAYTKVFYTEVDPTPKLPLLPNDEDSDNDNTNDLLSVVQSQTFKYFYDFAHPASGMARERNTSGDLVTSGGSGFGIMALIVGMERNFITREQGLERMDKIVDFLETSDRFHGAWSHWINGNTGKVIPFSANDNGGDLVETAFLVEGLITFRQYLNAGVPAEQTLINRINVLWKGVEWDWYRQNNQNVLYWHWSPDKNWVMNHQIKGWNEALIIYTLAAAADSDNTIPKSVYDAGWASNGGMKNGRMFEGVTLPLGFDYGGPLFFTHYSFLGLDPRKLNDQYANYWTQNVSHTQINYKYSVRNPKKFVGYGENCWGLTASDNQSGYSAHSPTNDLGVITPTAALSSFPYTPVESMKALKFFYYTMGDKLWGQYGFYDAFNVTENWYANSYLAIDQGPIVVMIENYRTGLLWNLFMTAPEVKAGLDKLEFTYE
jgi:hypothetical protein